MPLSIDTLSPIMKEKECIHLDVMDFIVALDFTQVPASFGRLGP
jgi:hypothetical protein